MTYYLVVFAAGFAGSFHCVGMCGGFACALGRDPRGGHGATVLRHLLYNSGRLTTYCFLGALAGALGQVVCTPQGATVTLPSGSFDAAERILAIVAGLLMIGMALQFFGLLQALSSPCDRLRQQHVRHVPAQPADDPRPRCAARFWGVQRLPAVSLGLCLRRPRRRAPARALPGVSHHGVVRIGDLPCHADDGRRRAGSCAGVAATWRVVGWQLHSAARPYHSRPRHPADRRAYRTWLAGRTSRMTDDRHVPPLLADHRAARDAAHGERRELCVLLLRLLYRLSGEEREERGVGGGLAPDPTRRGRLSLHEHHVVQPPVVYRHLHRSRREAASLGSPPALDLCDAGGGYSRRTIPARDLARWPSGPLDLLGAHRVGVGAAYVYSAVAVIERRPARLFRYGHHGADAVHAWPLSGGGRPRQGGARSRTAVGGGTRMRRRGERWGGDSPPGAGGQGRHAGAGAAG